MDQLIHSNHLQPGDTVVVPKSDIRMIQHFAIYLGQDEYGEHWFSDNMPGTGVRVITASDFFAGVIEITRVERFNGTEEERKQLVHRALSKHGRPYSLLGYNCESYVNDVRGRGASSKQVGNGIVIAFFGLLIGAALSSSSDRNS
jgi:uncharacterized protein YycO